MYNKKYLVETLQRDLSLQQGARYTINLREDFTVEMVRSNEDLSTIDTPLGWNNMDTYSESKNF